MTITYYPFDAQTIYQAQWSSMMKNRILDGVFCGADNDLFVYGDASGMQVKVKSGMMHIKGHVYRNDAEQTLAIAAAPGTVGQSRYDLIVGEVDWTNRTMSVKVVQGTASSSPTEPSLTRTTTVWQIQLARVTVSYGDTNVPANKVLDRRSWALGTFDVPFIIGNGITTISTGAQPVAIAIPGRSKAIGYSLVANTTGSIVIDLWKDTIQNYPPTVADTICATAGKPTLSSARTARFSVWSEATNINESGVSWPGHEFGPLSRWDALYYLLANVDSVSGLSMVNLTVRFARMVGEQS